jgi:urease accessory protein
MTPLHGAPELAAYHDEPAQMPSGAPGKVGYLRLGFAPRRERTELVDLARRVPLLVQQALHWDEAMAELACVMVVTTSGGILQGDRHAIEIDLAPGARAHVTSQSATKIQEMDANYASQTQHLVARAGSYLEYLPEPIIPYRHSRFVTDTTLVVHPTATVLYGEILTPGRTHYRDGEVFEYDLFSSTLRAARESGDELFIDKFLIEPHAAPVGQRGMLGDFQIVASVILLAPPQTTEGVLARVPVTIGADPELATGAGRLPNEAGLLYRVLGMDCERVRAQVREFWALVRRQAVGKAVPPPFPWR